MREDGNCSLIGLGIRITVQRRNYPALHNLTNPPSAVSVRGIFLAKRPLGDFHKNTNPDATSDAGRLCTDSGRKGREIRGGYDTLSVVITHSDGLDRSLA